VNRQEYAEYECNVSKFFEREGLERVLSPVVDSDGDYEPYFSWASCDCCGSHLGGNRFSVTGVTKKGLDIVNLEVCQDCFYYVEYGRLDDMTMMEMDDS
jgi:hypothetical protein